MSEVPFDIKTKNGTLAKNKAKMFSLYITESITCSFHAHLKHSKVLNHSHKCLNSRHFSFSMRKILPCAWKTALSLSKYRYVQVDGEESVKCTCYLLVKRDLRPSFHETQRKENKFPQLLHFSFSELAYFEADKMYSARGKKSSRP